jgi:hypothetical protein
LSRSPVALLLQAAIYTPVLLRPRQRIGEAAKLA